MARKTAVSKRKVKPSTKERVVELTDLPVPDYGELPESGAWCKIKGRSGKFKFAKPNYGRKTGIIYWEFWGEHDGAYYAAYPEDCRVVGQKNISRRAKKMSMEGALVLTDPQGHTVKVI